MPDLEKFYEAAAELNLRLGCNAVGNLDGAIIPMGDPRAAKLEHVCHELAHAFLLGLEWKYPLSTTVDRFIQKLKSRECDAVGAENETQTFAVVMGVLDVLGAAYDRGDMMEGNRVQVEPDGWDERDISREWSRFEKTDMFSIAVIAIVQRLEEEVARAEEYQRRQGEWRGPPRTA